MSNNPVACAEPGGVCRIAIEGDAGHVDDEWLGRAFWHRSKRESLVRVRRANNTAGSPSVKDNRTAMQIQSLPIAPKTVPCGSE